MSSAPGVSLEFVEMCFKMNLNFLDQNHHQVVDIYISFAGLSLVNSHTNCFLLFP